MSHIKKLMVNTSLLALVTLGGYSWINQTPDRSQAIAEKITSMTQTAEDNAQAGFEKTSEWTGEKKAAASQAWDNIGLDAKVDALQQSARPIRTSMLQTVAPITSPVARAAKKVDKKISLIGIVFMLVAGFMVAVMAASLVDDKSHA